MKQSLRYKCRSCNEWHEGLPSPGWDYPFPYLRIPEEERERRIVLTKDRCVIDGAEFYVRANLDIPIRGGEQPLCWGVWVSLSEASFRQFEKLFDDSSREPNTSFFGWLCSSIPGYPDTALLKTRIHIQPWPTRPLVELEPTDHPLAVDWRNGITVKRAVALVQPFVAHFDS
jgi:hypothetical protein